MERFRQLNILDYIRMFGEAECREIISTYQCPLNVDIEHFIHNNAIEFAKQQIASSVTISRNCLSFIPERDF